MNKSNIIKHIENEMKEKRAAQMEKVQQNLNKIRRNKEFIEAENALGGLKIEWAKASIEGKSLSVIEAKMEELKTKMANILQMHGMTTSSIEVSYDCSICKDTGYTIDGKRCSCMKKRISEEINANCGCDLKNISFEDCDKLDEKIKKTLIEFCAKYPNTEINTLIFSGAVGVGKSYLSRAMAKNFIDREFYTIFTSAIGLNNEMLSYHVALSENKEGILDKYFDCDVLFIDDLGTEPMLNNVTREYLLMLINERCFRKKLTVISTNLTPEGIIARYNERIFSRLFHKKYSLAIKFTGVDNRING